MRILIKHPDFHHRLAFVLNLVKDSEEERKFKSVLSNFRNYPVLGSVYIEQELTDMFRYQILYRNGKESRNHQVMTNIRNWILN